jgi:hypothetical protein
MSMWDFLNWLELQDIKDKISRSHVENSSTNNSGNTLEKIFLQLYRMLISFIFLPFYIFSLRHIEIKKVIFIVSLVALFSGIVGESVNFISSIREFMFYKIVSNNQIFIPGFWRNMGFTGEGSYFADLIVITIFLNIFYNTKWKKFFLISLFLILISTFSKSVLLSFLVTIILYLIYIKKAM